MASSSRGALRHVVDRNRLIDLGYSGCGWNNKRVGKANIQERLDRGFVNEHWHLLFPNASILCLTTSHSDHMSILLNSHPSNPSRPKPFRFEGMWVCDLSAGVVVKEAWSKGITPYNFLLIMPKIKGTKFTLKEWNVKYFENLHTSIRNAKLLIESIESSSPSAVSMSLEHKPQQELDELLT